MERKFRGRAQSKAKLVIISRLATTGTTHKQLPIAVVVYATTMISMVGAPAAAVAKPTGAAGSWLGQHQSNIFAFFKSKCSTIIQMKTIRVRQICIK